MIEMHNIYPFCSLDNLPITADNQPLPPPVNCSAAGSTWAAGNWDDGGQGAVMSELANLVGAEERSNMYTSHYINSFRQNRFRGGEVLETGGGELSGDESSTPQEPSRAYQDVETASSHNSVKSDKNLADFVDEDEACEEELARLAQVEQLGSMIQQQQLAHMAQLYQSRLNSQRLNHRGKQSREDWKQLVEYRLDRVTEPGNTLLWDLVQEGKVEQLAEGLAVEAEKALTNLLCYNMERVIRIRFIEGCVKNLESNSSVVVSLKLLPKLLQSFHNFPGSDTHDMTMYIEKTHHMTEKFFENLQTYTRQPRRDGFYSHATQVQVRLHFLAVIFSNCLSPESFRLSQNQVGVLWECLARDDRSAEDLAQWLLAQSHSKDQHALALTSIRFLYREKLPELKPEAMTMTGLNLLFQFGSLARSSDGSPEQQMDQVWRIALQAENTDVSLKAIHLVNTAYLGRGEEFITTCMSHLQEATSNLNGRSEGQLVKIQRALLLLKSHMETFR